MDHGEVAIQKTTFHNNFKLEKKLLTNIRSGPKTKPTSICHNLTKRWSIFNIPSLMHQTVKGQKRNADSS